MIAALNDRLLPEGGFLTRPDGHYRCDATAWAILAAEAHGASTSELAPSRARLTSRQRTDGGLAIDADHGESLWPTPLAAMAWAGSSLSASSQRLAVRYLLESQGLHWDRVPESPIGHDTSIPGWAWTLGAHSFVEPTVLSLLALSRAGEAGHERAQQGAALLLDRQLSAGGWNYGNTLVFGQELVALPSTTGMALCALAGRVARDQVERSLNYLQVEAARIRTPLSLGWALAALDGFGERSDQADAWIEETLARQSVVGAFETSELALLLIGSAPQLSRRDVLGVFAS